MDNKIKYVDLNGLKVFAEALKQDLKNHVLELGLYQELLHRIENLELYKIVDSLPEIGDEDTIYLLKNPSGSGDKNVFIEYLYNNEHGWEEIGNFTPSFDLEDYLKVEDAPFEKGEAENSAVLKGGNNQVISEGSVALGKDNISGLKGWYYKAVQIGNDGNVVYLYLTTEQQIPVLVSTANAVENQEKDININISKGDICSIINGNRLIDCFEFRLNEISNYGRISFTYKGEGTNPLSTIQNVEELKLEDYSVFCISKPSYGIVELSKCNIALGNNTKSLAESSVSIGLRSTAAGITTYAEGQDTIAVGECAHAEGAFTKANGIASHTEGFGTQTEELSAHAEGYNTLASGGASHSEGSATKATGLHSHSEGDTTEASGEQSHAEGRQTIAEGKHSHSEGYLTKAFGDNSHAEGDATIASGDNSHTEGTYTIAYNKGEHAEGIYNKSTENVTLHSVGIGTSVNDRKNAHEITNDGKHYILGVGGYNGTNPDKATDVASQLTELSAEVSGLSEKIDNLPSGGGGGNSPIVEGEVENSAIFNGEVEYLGQTYKNRAISQTAIALGGNTISGLKGYYITYIDFDTNEIWVHNERPQSNLKVTFEWEKKTSTDANKVLYSAGIIGYGSDVISIICKDRYYNCGEIKSISGNKIVLKESLPFTQSEVDEILDLNSSITNINRYDELTLFVISKPDVGPVDLGGTSLAEGLDSKAIGGTSHAEGYQTIAYGKYAHTEGYQTEAGYRAHAEGYMSKASGENSHTEGRENESIGNCSHAEGRETSAVGNFSHSEGYKTRANGGASHAEGSSTEAGENAHSEGLRTKALGENSHSEGKDTVANGDSAHAEGTNTTASKFAHAEGWTTTASGDASHSEGSTTTASGPSSHAEGYTTTASGDNSHAEGESTEATNYNAHAEGKLTVASGDTSHAEGQETQAIGTASHAEGVKTKASEWASHVEGYNCETGGDAEVNDKEADKDEIEGQMAHAEGNSTIARGNASHAEGTKTIAVGKCSHAQNYKTQAIGIESHAEGSNTIAEGATSHAEGYLTKAIGENSHAEGEGTVTNNKNEHASGQYNLSTKGGKSKATHFSIGIGTSNERKNAFEVKQDGKHYILGVGDYDGTTTEGATDVATVINNLKTSGGGSVTPDWNAAEGEAGYIKNKPFYGNADYIIDKSGEYNNVPEGDVIFCNKVLFNLRDIAYNDVIVINSGPPVTLEKRQDNYGKVVLIIEDIGNYLSLHPIIISNLVTIPEIFIPDTIARKSDIVVDPIVWKYICNPLIIEEGTNIPDELYDEDRDWLKYEYPAMYRFYDGMEYKFCVKADYDRLTDSKNQNWYINMQTFYLE